MKIKLSENCSQTLLDDGFWLHEEKQKDGKIFSFTFVKYWHSYEIKHEMRDFASNSPVSYIKLGQKLNELGLCLKNDANSWNLKHILIAISDKNEVWINRRLVDMDAVQANVEKLHAENPQGGAVIQADERSEVGLMVEVIDAVRLAGVEQYSIAASEKN